MLPLKTAIIERGRSVEEALVETYLAGMSVEKLWTLPVRGHVRERVLIDKAGDRTQDSTIEADIFRTVEAANRNRQ
jgi:hypothetical protein